MGNGQKKSSDDFGNVFVSFNQSSLLSGETASGVVYLNILKQFDGNNLNIKVQGIEKVHWITTTHTKNGTHHHHHRATNEIFSNVVNLYTFPQKTIQPGQYAFPFSFLVPSGVPGSMIFDELHAYASITYVAQAIIETHDKKKAIFHETMFIIREPVTNQFLSTSIDRTYEILKCCCSQGSAYMKIQVDKSTVFANDKIQVLADIDFKNSKANCQNITFFFKQIVIMTLPSGRSTIRQHDFPMLKQTRQGIQSGQSTQQSFELQLPGCSDIDPVWDPQHESYRFNTQDMVPPSVHGRLVSSTYCVQLVCETDLVCTGIPPFVNLPIKVHSNLCMKQFVPQYPPNWHPMMMQPMVLPMSVAPYVVNQAPPMLGDNNLMQPQLIQPPMQNMQGI